MSTTRSVTKTTESKFKEIVNFRNIRYRLNNINKKVTKEISFEASEPVFIFPESLANSNVACLEDINKNYPIDPSNIKLQEDRNIYAYDESLQEFSSLEGVLSFYSFCVIKIEDKYRYNLEVAPYFVTQIKKYQKGGIEGLVYAESSSEAKNRLMLEGKIKIILGNVEENSIFLIDGPVIGGNASTYMVNMDKQLRAQNCVPVYFVKNSDSRLIVDNLNLSNNFNSDFHWATKKLAPGERSALFVYRDKHNKEFTKVFTYIKALKGFPERIEMHTSSYEKYKDIFPSLIDLIGYYYLAQGDYKNPQVRPIAIAEKYARASLKSLNIPLLLRTLNFSPTVNQVRFG